MRHGKRRHRREDTSTVVERTGWRIMGGGIALIIVAVVVLICSQGDPWDTSALVIAMMAGAAIGTGGSMACFPTHYLSDDEDEPWDEDDDVDDDRF